ncbi:basic proline-rich protein-like [Microtus oregoni]|uniref:basic proline-rich protein-like n=1 Tax=Microtus oregoni TaxID=111838 RepID=UPI001BB1BC51|nr:basic proline-rich protein-like [Microtus oregoni]
MPAGRDQAPRPGGRPPTGGRCAAGREQSPTRAKGQRVPPLRRRTAHRAPASPATRNPAPQPRESAPRRAPTLARAPPPPLGPLGPPRPGPARGGGNGVSRRHCSPASALHHVTKEKRSFTRGAEAAACVRRPARGDPAGEARGGEAAGQGVGGERAAPPQRPPPPAPASTFLYSPGEARAPSPAVLPRFPAEDTQRSWGAGSPRQPAPPGANLAARPAPQPFSRGGDRGGGVRSCRLGSRTRSLPGTLGTARPASPSPPAELPTAPGPHHGSSCSRRFAHSAAPAAPLPTHLLRVQRAVSSPVRRPTDRRGPPSGKHRSRPQRQFLRRVPHSPRFTATIHQITSC